MNVRYRVELSQTERGELKALLSGGKHAARKLKRAQILLAADAGAGDEEITRSVGVSGSTVYRTKRRFVLGNLEAALSEEPRPGADRKLSGKEEALLVATACSSPPEGRARWTLELLADEMVRLTEHDDISRETVRRRLAENELKPWRKDMWCIPQVDGEFVARMEDVLDLYAQAPDPKRPVVCFDESPTQLIGEVRQPIKAKPGQLERFDCEYKRNGTANLFIFLDVHRPWRKVKVTDSRTAVDFAACMRELVDLHFPKAERIRVVLDNLSTHTAGALYQAFPPGEARRLLRRLEFHYVPKHASWLNMVEIEIGVLRSQCLDRRIDNHQRLVAEIAAWERQRNTSRARIDAICSADIASPQGVVLSCRKFVTHMADAFIQSGEVAQRHSEVAERTAGGPAELVNTITFEPADEPQVVWSSGDVKVSATRSTHIAGHVSYRADTPAGSVVIGGDAGNDVLAPPRSWSTSDQVEKLAKGADIIVHSSIHPIMGPGKGSGMFPYAYYRQSTVPDLGAMAQRAGAKHLILTHLIPPVGADQQYPFKVPGKPLTEDDYRKATRDGGFTGNIIVGTDLASLRLPPK